MDACLAPIWVAVTALLLFSSGRACSRICPVGAVHEVLLHSAVCSWAVVAGVAVVLGAVGVLNGPILLLATSLVACMLLGISQRDSAARRPFTHDACSIRRIWYRRGWALAWGALFAVWVGHVIYNGLLTFPNDWDTLMYHLPLVDHWLQAGGLYAPDCHHWSNPGNNELLALWAVAPFSGDFLAALNNLPATVLLALAAIQVGRCVGLSRDFSHLAALAVVSVNVVQQQLVDASNDVAVAALFLATLAYGLRYVRGGRGLDVVLGGLSLGLLAGVKYYALGYAALAWVLFVALTAAARGSRRAVRIAGVWLAGAALWGGYWYVRNTLVTGSPFYPLGIRPENDLLSQHHPDIWRTTFLGNGNPEIWPLALSAVLRHAGPCHLLTVLVLPASVGYLLMRDWRAGRSTAGRADRLIDWGFVLLLVGSAAVLLVTPLAVEDQPGTLNQVRSGYCPCRYGLCFLSLAVLALAVVLNDTSLALRRVVAYLLVAHATRPVGPGWGRLGLAGCVGAVVWLPAILLGFGAAYQAGTPAWVPVEQWCDTLLLGANLFLVVTAATFAWWNWPGQRKALALSLGLALVVAVSASAAALGERWHRGFAGHYDAQFGGPIFSQLGTAQDGERVCVLDYRPYPFFGSRRQYRVCQPHLLSSSEAMLDYLRSHEATVLAVLAPGIALPTNRFGCGHRWVAEYPAAFTPWQQSHWFHLFRANLDALEVKGQLPQADSGQTGAKRVSPKEAAERAQSPSFSN